jgi:integrase
VLADSELRLIWNAANRDSGHFGAIVRILILTGQREKEVAGMHRSELDLGTGMWTLPSGRTKNKKPHVVPLSRAAINVIEQQPVITSHKGFIFGNDKGTSFSGFSRAKERLDDAIATANGGEPISSWTIHDLRRTVATRMGDLGVQPHIIEAVLNHVSGHRKGVAGIYNHSVYAEPKRLALAAWASHVESVASGKQATNVIPLHNAR